MEKQIQVRIFPDGRIEAETKGMKGEECTNYIQLIEEMLRAETVESAYTEEYYETEQIHIQQTQHNKLKK